VYLDFLVSSRGSDLPKNVSLEESANKMHSKAAFLFATTSVLHTIERAYQGGVEENCVVMTGKVPPV
jgi:hypothetical protein